MRAMFSYLSQKKLLKKLEHVERYDAGLINLTANQNTLSALATRFYQSPMGLRYDFGRGTKGVMTADNFGNFSAITYPEMHDILDEADRKAKQMLHAEEVNLNCLSGAHAMLCALLGSTNPGDTIMSVREEDGGHFCTKPIVDSIGRKHVFAAYDLVHLTFDVKKTASRFRSSGARVLYLDTSVLLRPHPLKELRRMLPQNAVIIYDASHTLGLIMGGEFQAPLIEGADILSANTHKTFPGPHKGILAFKNKTLAQQMRPVIQNLYSTVHTNSLMALAVTVLEMNAYGRTYAKQIIRNSNAFGKALTDLGIHVRKAGEVYSYDHQVHTFIDISGDTAVGAFLKNGMSINTSDALGGKTFIRFGMQEITKRGMKEDEMQTIAFCVKQVLIGKSASVEVAMLNKRFPDARYSFPYSKFF